MENKCVYKRNFHWSLSGTVRMNAVHILPSNSFNLYPANVENSVSS